MTVLTTLFSFNRKMGRQEKKAKCTDSGEMHCSVVADYISMNEALGFVLDQEK